MLNGILVQTKPRLTTSTMSTDNFERRSKGQTITLAVASPGSMMVWKVAGRLNEWLKRKLLNLNNETSDSKLNLIDTYFYNCGIFKMKQEWMPIDFVESVLLLLLNKERQVCRKDLCNKMHSVNTKKNNNNKNIESISQWVDAGWNTQWGIESKMGPAGHSQQGHWTRNDSLQKAVCAMERQQRVCVWR